MKKKVMVVGLVAMTGALLTLTGCKGMCGMKHGKDCGGTTCGTSAEKCPDGCACAKCAAMAK